MGPITEAPPFVFYDRQILKVRKIRWNGKPRSTMTLSRVVAYLMGCIAFVASFLIYMEYIYLLGFPDGFITEVGYAERRLAYLFIGISVLFGLRFIYLGKIGPQTDIGKKLSATIMLYLISIFTIALIDYSYHVHLMGSIGG
jgi:hypothetical protein